MNIKNRKTNEQGKFPKIRESKQYSQVLEALFIDGIKMVGTDAIGILNILHAENVESVVIGGIVVGCHTGRPRATQDVDLIIRGEAISEKVIKRIGKLIGSKKVERHPSFISFIKKTIIGDREILDIITSKAGSYGLVFDNCKSLKIKDLTINIPSAEMMIVLKYTSAVNPVRSKAKQTQDWADIYSIIDANPDIKIYSVKHLADLVVPGFGQDLENIIKNHRRNLTSR